MAESTLLTSVPAHAHASSANATSDVAPPFGATIATSRLFGLRRPSGRGVATTVATRRFSHVAHPLAVACVGAGA